jgi:hypothetical protein
VAVKLSELSLIHLSDNASAAASFLVILILASGHDHFFINVISLTEYEQNINCFGGTVIIISSSHSLLECQLDINRVISSFVSLYR